MRRALLEALGAALAAFVVLCAFALLLAGCADAYAAGPADDTVLVGNGTTYQSKTLTNCAAASNAVTYTTATNAWGCNTSISASGLACSDCVELGAETTGGYAASVSEAGPATTATALAANGGNCAGSQLAVGVDASGVAECTSTIVASDVQCGAACVADAELSSNYSGTGACTAGQFAHTLNDDAAPTCSGLSTSTTCSGLTCTGVVTGTQFFSSDSALGVRLTAGSAGSNPAANTVILFVSETIDLGAGTGAADCGLRFLLSDGTVGNVVIMVTDGGCP